MGVFEFITLCNTPNIYLTFWHPQKYYSILDMNGIRRNIHYSGHLDCPAGLHIKFSAMPWAGDVIALNIALPHRTIIMRTYITNRK
jgi:hypothetical protein